MDWYYAERGQQMGPVGDAEFEQLIQTGRIRGDTLVWRQGMANWQPLQTVRGDASGAGAEMPPYAPPQSAAPWGGAYPAVMQPAGFWIRFLAKLLDWIILGFCVTPIVMPFMAAPHLSESTPEQFALAQLKWNLLGMVVTLIYSTLFLGRFGATPGKMICRLQVVTSAGSPISYGNALVRALAEILSGCPTLLVGYLMVAFTQEKRALHDIICSTRVIYKP